MSRSLRSGQQSRRHTPYFLRDSAVKIDYGYRTPCRSQRNPKGHSKVTACHSVTPAGCGQNQKKVSPREKRSSVITIPDAMSNYKESGQVPPREQYLPNPLLPGVGQLKFPDGSNFILLVPGNSTLHPILKIADTATASFSSMQLLGMKVYNGSDRENVNSNLVQSIVGDADVTQETINILRCGHELVCVGTHFLAQYVKDAAAWVLQGVTDGENPEQLYEVQHPPGKLICLQLAYGKHLSVREVAVEDFATLKMERVSKTVLDLFQPRQLATPNTVLRLYLNGTGDRLFALTNRGIFELEQNLEELGGFHLQMSLSNAMEFTDKTFRVTANGTMAVA